MPAYDPAKPEPTESSTKHCDGQHVESEFDSEANIHSLFDKSVSRVWSYSSKVQQTYFEPAQERAKAFSQVYPVLSLFIGIYSALSFIPVLLFLCSSIFVLSASVIVAMTLALVFIVSVISFFGLLLFCTLFLISLFSIASTVCALSIYQLTRLIKHLREQPTWTTGVKQWASELLEFALSRLPDGQNVGDSQAQLLSEKLLDEDVVAKTEPKESGPF